MTDSQTTPEPVHIDVVNNTDPDLGSETRTISLEENPTPAQGSDFNSFIPDEYKEKAYIKNLLSAQNPQVELFKQFDNLQSMIGQRQSEFAPPADDASQEDWDKFYAKLRPEEPTAYELDLSLDEGLKDVDEFMKSHRNDDHLNQVKSLLHKHGLTKKQAIGLAKDFNALEAAQVKGILAQQKEAAVRVDQEFNKLTEAAFGNNLDSALNAGKRFIEQFVPQELRPYMASLPNEALLAFAAAGMEHERKFVKEDGRASGSSTSGVNPMQEMSRLIAEQNKLSPMDPKREQIESQLLELAKLIQR